MFDLSLRRAALTRSQLAIALVFFGVAPGIEAAENGLNAEVERLFSKWDRPDVPGCAVGVVRDGELVYSKGFGSAHLDYEARNDPQTIFEAGSAAKSFTCACIALLLDEGRVSVDDDICKYVPELHPHDPPVRIRHMIRCRSGLWAQWHVVQLAGWTSEPIQTPYTDDDLLALLAGQKTLPFEPGTQFQYGTSDYFLLGIVVQRMTGKTLAEFARERVFEPLGMTRTYYEQDPTRVVKNRAVGYYREGRGEQSHWRSWQGQATGAGGWNLKTCVEDLARWEANFLDNRLGGGSHFREFLSEGTLLGNRNVLDATPTGSYRGLKRIQFTGGMPGYLAAMTRFPEQRFAVICLSNNSSEISPWKMTRKIADIYLADVLDPEAEAAEDEAVAEPIDLPAEQLRDKVGTFRSEHRHIWRITLRDGKLWNTNHLKETYELHPLSPTRFRPDLYPEDTFVFHKPAPDQPPELKLEYDGGAVQYERVELVDPSSVNLDDYVGSCDSDELSITYHFAVQEGALAVRVGNRRWELLDATVRDEFVPRVRRAFDNRIFTFSRDEDGRVSGVSVALWRVKGIQFQRR